MLLGKYELVDVFLALDLAIVAFDQLLGFLASTDVSRPGFRLIFAEAQFWTLVVEFFEGELVTVVEFELLEAAEIFYSRLVTFFNTHTCFERKLSFYYLETSRCEPPSPSRSSLIV